MNSISKESTSSVIYASSAREICTDLKERFSAEQWFIATVMTSLTKMQLINQMNRGMSFSLIQPNSIHSNSR